ncbi:hypothetical protein [Acidocella aminolytica]|uniref:Uncharacterized protein n=1 Tax=Acidocella aminolytica 101 = DSM 11237 TaxID=1120923 RepID=A0A0D6PHY5_9PROT|nr:hypothetical protein [Acidocella aminolytica]GAN80991.1 hypothetical protein Aam_066_055 [Acidocella aminolytica 101 = DSM 11237]GBQ37078.1 hypothetical protein AA11237_1419 [Acidocella aminolytica 101 = DSM 11237]
MKFIILAAIVAATFFWVPQLLEGAPDSCSALALRAVALENQNESGGNNFGEALITGFARAFGGEVARELAARKFPDLPSGVSCDALYWQSVVDPGSLKQAISESRTD